MLDLGETQGAMQERWKTLSELAGMKSSTEIPQRIWNHIPKEVTQYMFPDGVTACRSAEARQVDPVVWTFDDLRDYVSALVL